MKIIVVPDTHGTDHWKRVFELINTADKIVVLGDEFDSFDISYQRQMKNAREIIQFKKKHPNKVCLCWSNHAMSYVIKERCSGYQTEHAFDIDEYYYTNKDLFESIYIFDKWLFSHAGISKYWFKATACKSLDEINQLFRERVNYFRWVGPDSYGNNLNEGPFWIRPTALIKSAYKGYNQVIGHSELTDHPKEYISKTGEKIIAIDSRTHEGIIELDTKTNVWKRV